MNDAPDTAAEAPPAAPDASTDEGLRSIFPSMYPEAAPPAPTEPARTAPPSPPERSVAPTEPAATSTPAAEPPAPAASPVELRASGLSVNLPAGIEADPQSIAALDTIARDAGLDGATAQKLVDLHTAATDRYSTEIDTAWAAQRADWRATAERDVEIGGARLNENVALARSVLDRFGPGFKAAITDLGLGNHPELIRMLVRIGKALPAGASPSRSPEPTPQGDADAAYRSAFPSMYGK